MDCHDCTEFVGGAAALEREFAGLKILSSAYGSVCGGTGYCRTHDRMQPAIRACAWFRRGPRRAVPGSTTNAALARARTVGENGASEPAGDGGVVRQRPHGKRGA